MKREQRLRKGAEFDQVYSEGTVVGGPLVVLRVRPNALGHARWGFAVGKKIAPLATTRNLVRRRMREAVQSLGWDGPQDVVLTARKEAVGADYQALRAAIERAVRKIGRVSG